MFDEIVKESIKELILEVSKNPLLHFSQKSLQVGLATKLIKYPELSRPIQTLLYQFMAFCISHGHCLDTEIWLEKLQRKMRPPENICRDCYTERTRRIRFEFCSAPRTIQKIELSELNFNCSYSHINKRCQEFLGSFWHLVLDKEPLGFVELGHLW